MTDVTGGGKEKHRKKMEDDIGGCLRGHFAVVPCRWCLH